MMDVPGYGFHVGLRRRIPKRRRPDDSEGVQYPGTEFMAVEIFLTPSLLDER
jgi:hypothetical protein